MIFSTTTIFKYEDKELFIIGFSDSLSGLQPGTGWSHREHGKGG
jgi:hypothetical protein